MMRSQFGAGSGHERVHDEPGPPSLLPPPSSPAPPPPLSDKFAQLITPRTSSDAKATAMVPRGTAAVHMRRPRFSARTSVRMSTRAMITHLGSAQDWPTSRMTHFVCIVFQPHTCQYTLARLQLNVHCAQCCTWSRPSAGHFALLKVEFFRLCTHPPSPLPPRPPPFPFLACCVLWLISCCRAPVSL
jgi:hypothetical protein